MRYDMTKDNSHSDLVAQFLSGGGKPKVVPEGQRTLTPRQLKIASGYEPEKTYKFEVFLEGEDHMEFTVIESASSKAMCREKVTMDYPESTIISIEDYGTHSANAYKRAQEAYDNDEQDLY
jgi:hypothetical protein